MLHQNQSTERGISLRPKLGGTDAGKMVLQGRSQPNRSFLEETRKCVVFAAMQSTDTTEDFGGGRIGNVRIDKAAGPLCLSALSLPALTHGWINDMQTMPATSFIATELVLRAAFAELPKGNTDEVRQGGAKSALGRSLWEDKAEASSCILARSRDWTVERASRSGSLSTGGDIRKSASSTDAS